MPAGIECHQAQRDDVADGHIHCPRGQREGRRGHDRADAGIHLGNPESSRRQSGRCRENDQRVTRVDVAVAVDVSIGGEITESGSNTEYVLDAAAAGRLKGMIMLGHMMSEDHGMQEVADWLRTFLAGVPIAFVSAGEPFTSS